MKSAKRVLRKKKKSKSRLEEVVAIVLNLRANNSQKKRKRLLRKRWNSQRIRSQLPRKILDVYLRFHGPRRKRPNNSNHLQLANAAGEIVPQPKDDDLRWVSWRIFSLNSSL